MRFQVPQFIEVEDKIFGPLTFKQFVYLAGGAGFAVAAYVMGGFFVMVLLGLPVGALGAALAFIRINNRPFIEVMQSALYYATRNKLYLWKKSNEGGVSVKQKPQEPVEMEKIYVPKLSENKLKDLAWSLDIKESLYSEEAPAGRRGTIVGGTPVSSGEMNEI